MSDRQADVEDVDGIPLRADELDQSGDALGQQEKDNDLATSLGLQNHEADDDSDEEDDDGDEDEDDEEDNNGKKKPSQQNGKPDKKGKGSKDGDPHKLADGYADRVQREAEEAYAQTLYRAKNEEGYLDKLVQDKDPIAQRLAKKIIERNADLSGGAKTVEEFQSNLRKKAAGNDPVKLKQLDQDERIARLEKTDAEKSWSQWKEKNRVTGDAEKLADDVHARYPDMPPGEVMDTVKGKMGGTTHRSDKDDTSALLGGGNSPHGDDSGLSGTNPSLMKALLPNAKKTAKFAKGYVKEMRR